MKNTFLILLLLISGPVMACTVSLSSTDSTGIQLQTTTATVKTIATISENCPVIEGYVITISSKNGSNLKSTRAAYPYQISYDHSGFISLDTPYFKTYTDPSTSQPKPLEIMLSGIPNPAAGAYSDTITISVSSR
jgi:spore coat protein U-like protein